MKQETKMEFNWDGLSWEPELIDWDEDLMKPFIDDYANCLHILQDKIEEDEFEKATLIREELEKYRLNILAQLINIGYSGKAASIMINLVVEALNESILGIKTQTENE